MGNNESSSSRSDYEERRRQENRERERREIQARYDYDRRILEEQLSRVRLEREAEASKAKTELEEKLAKLEAEKRAAEERRLKEPWRKFERNGGWTEEYHEKLLKQIKEQTIHDDLDKARLVFMGPIRAGKSSFINSVASIDKNRISSVVESGAALKSLSQKLKQYIPKKILQNCILMDTMGVEEQEEEGFNVQDVIYLMQGNVKPDYRFNPRSPITDKDSNFNANPSLSDKAHCIIIVMDSIVIDSDSITDASKKKIEVLQKHIRNHEVPVVIVLTKIDELCEEVANDIKTTYHSRAVATVVKKAHELFGVPKTNIFPVKNYAEDGDDLDENMSILIMLALRKMMQIASDRLETLDDNK